MTWAEAVYHSVKWIAIAACIIASFGGLDFTFITGPEKKKRRR